MISQNINQQIKDAMKARDTIRLSTLKMLLSALNYEKIAKQHDLTEDEEVVVVKKEAKKRKDAIEGLKLAQGKATVNPQTISSRLAQENEELVILEEFLPAQISDDELQKIIDEVFAEVSPTSMKDMGKVIGEIMKRSNGNADGAKVSVLVKARIEKI